MPRSPSLISPPITPSSAQIALAIAIVRSKPPAVALRDYILQLREHCREGQPAYNAQNLSHYLDLVGYWQDQCRKAQEECARLRSVNIRLERSNHQLAQQNDANADQRPGTAPSPSKRKAPSPSKRARSPTKASEQSVARTQIGIESDYEFLDGLGDDGKALIEALHQSYQLCKATAPDTQSLCHHLVQTSKSLGKVVRLASDNYEYLSRRGGRISTSYSLSDDRSDFSQALTVAARTFMAVLVGIGKMIDAICEDRLPGLIICELVDMFRTVLLAIESSARHTAEASSSLPTSPKKGKVRAPSTTPRESVPARSLAHFLMGLIGLLDKANSIHQKIFDGFVFVLLERVGKRLYYCTFGRHRRANIAECLLPEPESANEADMAKQDTEALGIRLEVKALVLILERAMGLAPHHMNASYAKTTKSAASSRITRTLSLKTLPSAPKGRLSSVAKDRLQRTLVACMYGTDSNDEFLDVLTKPVPGMRIGTSQNVSKISDENVQQWYKEQVWRLVGWDIMARENGS